ncbi:MAG: hypothetical protein K2X56_11115 [Mycobacterium pseudokansasii]|uniref:hypothetical protein n=1 Tax=Mycobacterium pseudokansasii TaxID=2341080 RepID=UPI003C6DA9B9|nr:hypothetical protein [Mycobacterium pseudokansasii]
MVVDGVDPVVFRQNGRDTGLWEGLADTGHGCSDLGGDLLVQADQLHSPQPDVAREGLRLSLPGGPLRCRPTSQAVGDRKVITHRKARRASILDGVTEPRARCKQIRGTATGNLGRLMQLVNYRTGRHHVVMRLGSQCIGGCALPIHR